VSSERGAGRFALIAVTLFWGSSFVVVQSGVEKMAPLVLVALRFGVAALALAVIRPAALKTALRLLPATAPLALLNIVAYSLQSTGLETTTPSRSAFLTALSVVLVPAIVSVGRRRPPDRRIWMAAALALVGVWLLFRPLGREWLRGDTLTLLSALVFALFIVELGRMARRHAAVPLVLSQSLTTAAVAGLLAPILGMTHLEIDAGSILSILYLGIACTALVFFLMAWGQARVEASEAVVIYTLEPVLAAILSVLVGRDAFAWGLVQGGAMILIAMAVAGRE